MVSGKMKAFVVAFPEKKKASFFFLSLRLISECFSVFFFLFCLVVLNFNMVEVCVMRALELSFLWFLLLFSS